MMLYPYGVYQIRNTITNVVYIGSTAIMGFDKRWNAHQRELDSQLHHCRYLQHAWNKYDADVFMFDVLLYCDPESCLMYEQLVLDYHKSKYNMCQTAGSTLGFKHSSETKMKLSQMRKGQPKSKLHKQKISCAHLGKRFSENHKQKLSQSHLGIQAGEKHPQSKLAIQDIKEIRCMLSQGILQKEIADRFEIDQTTVSNIKVGKTWKDQ